MAQKNIQAVLGKIRSNLISQNHAVCWVFFVSSGSEYQTLAN